MERLTALAVPRRGGAVPRRAPARGADGGRRARPAGSASSCSPGTRPTTRSRCWPPRRPPASGSAPARVAVGARTWAEHALGVQRALPGSALELAGPVLDRLRMVKSAGRDRGARRSPARRSTACTPAWRSGCGSAAPRPRSAPTSPRRSSPRGTSASTSRSSGSGPERRQPAPRALRPHRAGRRPRRRRHRRGDRDRLPVGLHPHLRGRRVAGRRGRRVVRRPAGRAGGRHRRRPARA